MIDSRIVAGHTSWEHLVVQLFDSVAPFGTNSWPSLSPLGLTGNAKFVAAMRVACKRLVPAIAAIPD